MELGTLVQYFKADLSDFDRGVTQAEQRMGSVKSSFSRILDDISGDINSKFGAGGRYVGAFVNDLTSGSEKSAQAAARIREQLKGLEEQAAKVKNRFSDFSEATKIQFGGKIDTDFLKQFRSLEDEGAKFKLLAAQFGKDAASMVTPIEKAAFSFSKLERDGTAALGIIEGKTGALTKELLSLEGRTAGVSAALSAVAGPAAIAAAAVGLAGIGIFNLTKETAAAGAGLIDLNQRTGISVQLLSALSLVTDTTGGNIKTLNTQFGKYLQTVSEANHKNEEAAKKLKQVGIDYKEAFTSPDKAVQLLIDRIGQLSNEEDKLNALRKVGIKNGQDLNAAINEINQSYGSLYELQKRGQQLGLIITKEQAEEADKFDDTLSILEKQIKAVGYAIGRGAMPEITKGIQDVSKWLEDNKDKWPEWAAATRKATHDAIDDTSKVINALSGIGDKLDEIYNKSNQAGVALHKALTPQIPTEYSLLGVPLGMLVERLRAAPDTSEWQRGAIPVDMSKVAPQTPEQIAALAKANKGSADPVARAMSGALGDNEDKAAESAAQKAARRALQIAEVDLAKARRIYSEANEDEERKFKLNLETLGVYSENKIKALNELYRQEQAVFKKERDEIKASNLEPGEKKVRSRQLDEKEAAAKSEHDRKIEQIQKDTDQRQFELTQQHNANELRITEAHYATLNQLEQHAAAESLMTFEQAENARYNRQREIYRKQVEALKESQSRMANDSVGYQQIADQIKTINEKELDDEKSHFQKLRDERLKDLESAQAYARGLRSISDTIIDINRQIEQIEIQALEGNSFHRSEAIGRQRELEIAAAQDNLRRTTDALKEQREVVKREAENLREINIELAKKQTEENLEETQKQIATVSDAWQKKQDIIAAINQEIAANENLTGKLIEKANREAQDKLLQKWKEIAQDIGGVISDAVDEGITHGARAGLKSLAQSALDTIRAIEKELLNSVIYDLLTGQRQGSNAGGIAGAVTNKLLDLLGLGPKKGAKSDPAAASTDKNTVATDENTRALKELSEKIGSSLLSGGDDGSGTLDEIASNTGDTASAVDNGTARVVSAVQSLQRVTEMLIPHQQGFWEGLLGAVVSGAIRGAMGGAGGGGFGDIIGGIFDGGGSVSSVIRDADTGEILSGGGATRPRRVNPPHRAHGGRVEGGELYEVNEMGLEFFRPDADGEIIPSYSPIAKNYTQNQNDGNITIHPGAIQIHVHNDGRVERRGTMNHSANFPAANRRKLIESVAAELEGVLK